MTLLPFTLAAILSLSCIPFVYALPLNCTSTPTLNFSDSLSSSGRTRTLCDIIWSCAATLFACSWAVVHPNIPGMHEGRMAIFFRRLSIMVLALIAPELMVTWATMQFLSARDTEKAFNKDAPLEHRQARSGNSDVPEETVMLTPTSNGRRGPHSLADTPHDNVRDVSKWTMTHGYFAWMGGFMLYCDDKPRATLTPGELYNFVRGGDVDTPVIVEAEIEDRSKRDALSKGIAILQLAWFVLQLVARRIQHLPTTLLEIDTLAVVSLAIIPYCLWWSKPQDVRRPYPVYWKNNSAQPPPHTLTYEKENPEFFSDGLHHYLSVLTYPLRSLMGTRVTISPRAVRERRIPSLGGYDDHDPHDCNHTLTLVLGCSSAAIFGVIHFLGWGYLFQWRIERVLWRATAVVTASASLPLLLIFGLVIWLDVTRDSRVVKLTVAITALVYIIIRITVIALIISSLQSLPPGIYNAVAWTTFIPHI